MYIPSTSWTEQLKNLINEVTSQRQFVLDGVVTSVNNTQPYTVKVMLEPYQIESGWIPILSPYAGNGFGLILPPPADGQHVKVICDMGDINNCTVVGGLYNNVSVPPTVNFGDLALFHESGSNITMKSDGSIVFTSKSGASLTLDGADKTVTINGNSTQSW